MTSPLSRGSNNVSTATRSSSMIHSPRQNFSGAFWDTMASFGTARTASLRAISLTCGRLLRSRSKLTAPMHDPFGRGFKEHGTIYKLVLGGIGYIESNLDDAMKRLFSLLRIR